MQPVTGEIPKSMITINNKPFLQHQLDLLKGYQIHNIVLCIGYLANQIKDYFKDGKEMGINIRYSEEKEPLGTAGALKNAEPLLDDEFLVMNGDSYLMLNYTDIIRYFKEKANLALMVVYKNYNHYENSNVTVNDGFVKLYSRSAKLPEMVYVDAGLYLFKKEVLKLIPDNRKTLLDGIFNRLAEQKELLAYEVSQRFYEVGSMSGLKDFEKFLED